jgi:Family of unknown function (DUF5675)
MEPNVWQLIVQAVSSLLSPSEPSSGTSQPASGGASPSAQESDALLISTWRNATTLVVIRDQETSDGIFGELAIDGEKVCLTLENRALSIPAGQYDITIYDSPHAGHLVPLLQGVFGRSEIEIHCGNVPGDSKGCILLGSSRIGDSLERSRDAFNLVFPQIQQALAEGRKVSIVINTV